MKITPNILILRILVVAIVIVLVSNITITTTQSATKPGASGIGVGVGRYVVTKLSTDSANQVLVTQLTEDIIASSSDRSIGSSLRPWMNIYGRNLFGNLIAANYDTAPEYPLPGQIYFDKENKKFMGYDGEVWIELGTTPADGGQVSSEPVIPEEPAQSEENPLPPYVRTPAGYNIESGTPMTIDINRTLAEIQNGNPAITCIRIKVIGSTSPITYASGFLPIPEGGGVHYTFNNLNNGDYHSVRYHTVENCGTEQGPTYLEGGPNANLIFRYISPAQ